MVRWDLLDGIIHRGTNDVEFMEWHAGVEPITDTRSRRTVQVA